MRAGVTRTSVVLDVLSLLDWIAILHNAHISNQHNLIEEKFHTNQGVLLSRIFFFFFILSFARGIYGLGVWIWGWHKVLRVAIITFLPDLIDLEIYRLAF